jgi:integrase
VPRSATSPPCPAPFSLYPAADWWRGLLAVAYMTGWRIGSLLSLRWRNVDLKAASAISLAEFNKGGRDMVTPLHPLVVEHLERLTAGSFGGRVFPWGEDRRRLWDQFAATQDAAKVKPATGPKPHYGFHDLRRAFATMNADKLSADTLQALMQHRDYQTTQWYINMARQLTPAVHKLYVPELPALSATDTNG